MSFLPLTPLLLLLVVAAVIDLRDRRIPNWLSLTLVFSGLIGSCLFTHAISPFAETE